MKQSTHQALPRDCETRSNVPRNLAAPSLDPTKSYPTSPPPHPSLAQDFSLSSTILLYRQVCLFNKPTANPTSRSIHHNHVDPALQIPAAQMGEPRQSCKKPRNPSRPTSRLLPTPFILNLPQLFSPLPAILPSHSLPPHPLTTDNIPSPNSFFRPSINTLSHLLPLSPLLIMNN
jgi:hypothetical protein